LIDETFEKCQKSVEIPIDSKNIVIQDFPTSWNGRESGLIDKTVMAKPLKEL